MNPTILVYVLIAICAIMGGRLLQRDSSVIESKKRNLLKSSRILSDNGFTLIPEALDSLAISDPSTFFQDLDFVGRILTNPGTLQSELDSVLKKVLDKRIADPNVQNYLETALAKAGVTAASIDKIIASVQAANQTSNTTQNGATVAKAATV